MFKVVFAIVIASLVCYVRSAEIKEWTDWSDWSPCSVSCGFGVQQSVSNGLNVDGSFNNRTLTKYIDCYIDKECPVDGNWTNWSNWEYCSPACGPGSKRRFRECKNPEPAAGGEDCVGNAIETSDCYRAPCPPPPSFFDMRLCADDSKIFWCENGVHCVNSTQRCDRTLDCSDGTDEYGCTYFKSAGHTSRFADLSLISFSVVYLAFNKYV